MSVISSPPNKGESEGVFVGLVRNMKIYYNPKLKCRASKLRRKERTYAEKLLWCYLRNRKIQGYKFIRQKPIGNFIVDFYCPEIMLIIEADGVSHEGKEYYDQKRVEYFESLGLTVLRFSDDEIKNKIETTIQKINDFINNISC